MSKYTKIIQYFTDNEDVFNEAIEELDRYNGYLQDDRYYDMDELNELYAETPAEEVLRRAFYGHDAETWHTDSHGEKEYGPFNPNRKWFYFNGYGNLVSAEYKDYSMFLDEWFIDSLAENRKYLWLDEYSELNELLNEFEQNNEESEDE